MNPEDSSLGFNNIGGEESSMSVGKLGTGKGLGIDDSELTNNIVGIGGGDSTNVINTSKKDKDKEKDKEKKKKDKKKDKKKKKKHDSSSDDEKEKPPAA